MYLGSKMFRGADVFGKNIKFESGKMDKVFGSLINLLIILKNNK
tara:strand:+ start:3017 stop:3148 length:132 start_codon:yes stop_codon:yes gene_type:complete